MALGTTISALAGTGTGPGRAAPGARGTEPGPNAVPAWHPEVFSGGFLFIKRRSVAIPVNYRMLGQDIVFRTG